MTLPTDEYAASPFPRPPARSKRAACVAGRTLPVIDSYEMFREAPPHLRHQGLNVDGVVVLTDNETWAGRSHPTQELEACRRSVNPAVRTVIVSMTAVGYQIADPGDKDVLAVAGLDGALPKLISGFIR